MRRIEDEITDKIIGAFEAIDEQPDAALWKRLERQLNQDRRRKSIFWLWIDTAAIIVVAFGIGYSFFFSSPNDPLSLNLVERDKETFSNRDGLEASSSLENEVTALEVQLSQEGKSNAVDQSLIIERVSNNNDFKNRSNEIGFQKAMTANENPTIFNEDIIGSSSILESEHHDLIPTSGEDVSNANLTQLLVPLEILPISEPLSVQEKKADGLIGSYSHLNIPSKRQSLFRVGWYAGLAALSPAMAEFAGVQVQAGAVGSLRISSRFNVDVGMGLNWGRVHKDADPYVSTLSDIVFPDQTQEFFSFGSYIDRYNAGIWAIELPIQANYEWGKKRRQRMSIGIVSQIILSEDAEIRNLELRGIPESMSSSGLNFRVEERFYTTNSAIKSGTHQEWLAYMRIAYGIRIQSGSYPMWIEPFAQWSIQGVTTQSARMASAGFRISGVI